LCPWKPDAGIPQRLCVSPASDEILGNLGNETSDSRNRDNPSTTFAGVPQAFGEECGGKGGVPYLIALHAGARLSRIAVWHRDYVDGIQLITDQGALPRIGGTGKHRDVQSDTFEFESDEILSGISVEFWQYVERITFHTNHRNFGPFGGRGGLLKKTITGPVGRRIVGFRGRHWELVDSIQLMVA
jgi:hypothetical protein